MAKAKLPKVGLESVWDVLLWSLTSGYELRGSTQTVAAKEPQPGPQNRVAGLQGLDFLRRAVDSAEKFKTCRSRHVRFVCLYRTSAPVVGRRGSLGWPMGRARLVRGVVVPPR